MRIDFPEIKEVASIYRDGGQVTLEERDKQQKRFREDNFYYAEPEFFKMFDFGWLSGDWQTCLKNPNDAVLTQAIAEKYFGSWRSAIGKTFRFENRYLYTVRGILKNIPPNSDFPFGVVVPYSAIKQTWLNGNMNDWVSTFGGAYTFVVLPKELSPQEFDQPIEEFFKKTLSRAEYAGDAAFAQALGEIHYDDRFGNYNEHTFSHSLIKALSIIGIFLIMIACVNFINLATAQAVNRSREVGVRKVLGSSRAQLAFQFIGETAVITAAAVIIAVIVAKVTLPFLNKLLAARMSMSFISSPRADLYSY